MKLFKEGNMIRFLLVLVLTCANFACVNDPTTSQALGWNTGSGTSSSTDTGTGTGN